MNARWIVPVLSVVLALCAPATAQLADADEPPPRPIAPELSPNLGWLNTAEPLRFAEQLKGRVVVLDFWTSCCINCMHTLEDLKALEEKYRDEPVVFIGVHSAKFVNEMERRSIRSAVQRYGITHPVVIDDHMSIWQAYSVRGWPTFVIVGPDGRILAETSGEGRRDILDATIRNVLEYGRKNSLLADKPFHPVTDASVPSVSGLAFPGKVHAVAPTGADGPDGRGWLFIADSSHDRVIAATWPDADGRSEVVRVVGGGGGEAGLVDGPPDAARFRGPQGLAYDAARATLYVADTKNHAVRAISTRDWSVRTLAGDGVRGIDLEGGKSGRDQALASPWDVALSPDGSRLAVAMAGAHQLWTIDTVTGMAERLAGAGGESLFDGAAADAALAQPSGLAYGPTGERLYFVDAETSSLRVLDTGAKRVVTLVGHDLFVFGDGDGPARRALLQHPLGVSLFTPGKGGGSETLIVADTFNHLLRILDVSTGQLTTFMGVRRRAGSDAGESGLTFDEPGGVHVAGEGPARRMFVADTNNHRVLVIDPATRAWHEVTLSGLESPGEAATVPAGASRAAAPLAPGKDADFLISPALPASSHVNPEAPFTVLVREIDASGRPGPPVVQRTVRTGALPVLVTAPGSAVRAGATLLVEATFAVCTEETNATCRPASGAWVVTVTPGSESKATLR